jgi:hypothetical protein
MMMIPARAWWAPEDVTPGSVPESAPIVNAAALTDTRALGDLEATWRRPVGDLWIDGG